MFENREQFILENKPLVAYVLRNTGLIGCSYEEDLYSAGLEGLVTAADKYDPSTENSFSAYAFKVIRSFILREAQFQRNKASLSFVLKEYQTKVFSAIEKYSQTHEGHKPNVEYLLGLFPKLSKAGIMTILESSRSILSLDVPYDEECCLGDTISDVTESPEDRVIRKDVNSEIRASINQLSKREREIILRYFGLENGSPQTLDEVGKVFDISKERVRQIKKEALCKLKKVLLPKKDYLYN